MISYLQTSDVRKEGDKKKENYHQGLGTALRIPCWSWEEGKGKDERKKGGGFKKESIGGENTTEDTIFGRPRD